MNSAQVSNKIANVPNTLTGIRFLLAICVFACLPLGQFWGALIIFIVAVSTDWIDGYWARKYNQVTQFGRIFDPFVDKIIICGTFVFLVAVPNSGIAAWVAVLVMGREMLVTVIRSYVEQHGGDFSANWPAKWKMVLQCVAAILSILAVALTAGVTPGDTPTVDDTRWYGLAAHSNGLLLYAFNVSLWSMALLTLASGAIYVRDAVRMIRSGELTSSSS